MNVHVKVFFFMSWAPRKTIAVANKKRNLNLSSLPLPPGSPQLQDKHKHSRENSCLSSRERPVSAIYPNPLDPAQVNTHKQINRQSIAIIPFIKISAVWTQRAVQQAWNVTHSVDFSKLRQNLNSTKSKYLTFLCGFCSFSIVLSCLLFLEGDPSSNRWHHTTQKWS